MIWKPSWTGVNKTFTSVIRVAIVLEFENNLYTCKSFIKLTPGAGRIQIVLVYW